MSMPRQYSTNGNCVNTQSTTLPIGILIGATTIRPQIYEMQFGSDAAPADNAVKLQVQRSTTAGTWTGAGGAAITPQALDPGDPATLCTANQGVSTAGPTLTGSAFLWQQAINQRQAYRWIANPGSELVIPATSSAGLAFVPAVIGGSAYNQVFSILHRE